MNKRLFLWISFIVFSMLLVIGSKEGQCCPFLVDKSTSPAEFGPNDHLRPGKYEFTCKDTQGILSNMIEVVVNGRSIIASDLPLPPRTVKCRGFYDPNSVNK